MNKDKTQLSRLAGHQMDVLLSHLLIKGIITWNEIEDKSFTERVALVDKFDLESIFRKKDNVI